MVSQFLGLWCRLKAEFLSCWPRSDIKAVHMALRWLCLTAVLFFSDPFTRGSFTVEFFLLFFHLFIDLLLTLHIFSGHCYF